jgi:hypothetical protein
MVITEVPSALHDLQILLEKLPANKIFDVIFATISECCNNIRQQNWSSARHTRYNIFLDLINAFSAA